MLRGYDPFQVDVVLRLLKEALAAERQRADKAVRELRRLRGEMESGWALARLGEELGSDAATALRQAGRSASRMVAAAEGEAAAIVEESRAQADELLSAAQRRGRGGRGVATSRTTPVWWGAMDAIDDDDGLGRCPVCGREKTEWVENDGQGVTVAGVAYCSPQCAQRDRP